MQSGQPESHPLLREAPVLAVPTAGMARIPTLPALLRPAHLQREVAARRGRMAAAVLGWGLKPSAQRAARLAARRGLPLWRCEDGFVRSLGLGADGPPLSLVLDDHGIYYDARRASRLEALMATPAAPPERQRAEALRRLWCRERLSKYNGSRESEPPPEPFVLVVDQTAGDLSIAGGLADGRCFQQMLATALADHPGHTVLVKVHPEVAQGRRQGHLHAADLQHPRLRICADGGHPAALLERAEAVYVVTSQMGFEALLWGRPVHCFGMPFYAGWGLTHDRLPAPQRRRGGSDLAGLIHAALVAYPTYLDPHTGEPCPPERLMAVLGLQQRRRRELPGRIEAFGFKPWKQPILRRFLAGSQVRFRRRRASPSRWGQAQAIWGRDPGRGVARSQQQPQPPPLLRIEDGFLRSVGLGANLIAPVSWVIDSRGLYYDAGASSDLEALLAGHAFNEAERQRGAALRQQLLAAALTKYNLPASPWQRPAHARRVVLVPGQVESDASIRHGAGALRTNRALLEAVRAAEPGAWLLYKPHPDVVAGLRREPGEPLDLGGLCDEVVVEAAIEALYEAVDAVHVLTSLAGFEALLRGRAVHTGGLPFYAGWGLTHDRLTCPRRGRTLQLDELVWACLIAYPRYVSRHSGLFVEPEEAIEELARWRSEAAQPLRLWQRLFRRWGQLRERFRLDGNF
ncbi:MAG: capsular polysaccharide biosynthesis protein [Synechococcaceae cyanobacterium]